MLELHSLGGLKRMRIADVGRTAWVTLAVLLCGGHGALAGAIQGTVSSGTLALTGSRVAIGSSNTGDVSGTPPGNPGSYFPTSAPSPVATAHSAAQLWPNSGLAMTYGPGPSATARDATRWGDPLSTDLFGSDKVHASLHYYSDVGGNGARQGVGLSLTIPN